MSGHRDLYEWFAATAAAHPDETALSIGDDRFTYAELDRLAGRLAADLLRRGDPAPQAVGLHANRSPAAYAGYLAILRAGAAVVPIAPAWPAARRAVVVEAAGLRVVVSEDPDPDVAAKTVPADRDRIAELRALPDGSGSHPDTGPDPAPHRGSDRNAYVLFTSGSTGVPKGVPISHGNIDAYLRHVVPRYGLGPGDRVSQTFDLTFDLSVFDLFAAWGSGATVVVPGRNDLLSPARFVARERITHWFSVPSVISLASRLGRLPAGSMPTLRWSLFCGEALTLDQARAWHAAAPQAVLENLYGPTELTLSVAQLRLPADPSRWPAPANGSVPIGVVYPGHEHVVVGADGRPGEEGELCVRGPQRFAGYLDPANDTGRFLVDRDGRLVDPDPRPGTRVGPRAWYRTGDLVRIEDGVLVHLGRLDHQVKVQGYRVELGEIETVLREHPDVHEAVVLATPSPAGQELTGVWTGTGGAGIADLLAERLPRHMVPRNLVRFDRLPLNQNGKIDRSAISAALADR